MIIKLDNTISTTALELVQWSNLFILFLDIGGENHGGLCLWGIITVRIVVIIFMH